MKWLALGVLAVSLAGCGMPAGPAPGSGPAYNPYYAQPMSRPSQCSAAGNATCSGCSISCPAGKQASCREGEVHQAEGFSPYCWTKSKCECD
jgi:hypothetical protein